MADSDVKYVLNTDGSVDITAKQGATWEIEMTLTDDADQPLDLTGWSFRGQIRKKYSSLTPVASFDFTDSTPASGIVVAKVAASVTAAIPCKEKTSDNLYYYDMERYQGSPEVVRKDLPRGKLYVIPEATK